MAAVVFYMEDDSTLVHRLEKDSSSVGRHPQSDVVLTCPSSSSRHAVIKKSGNDFFVQDLGSSNGTRVNGAEIEEASLKDGDRIGFGDVQAVFYAGDPPGMDAIKKAAPQPKKALPVPDVVPVEKPADVPPPAARARLSPVRRAYRRSPGPGDYPDTAASGCMTAAVVIGLFVVAFIGGLYLRHSKEMNGDFITDFIEKLTDKVPKVKIERKADE
ncbi:MAG: FHA domain-containing protein [Verrucomicrobiaceae bacterium]|nr:FHA domain-containing protein [Verrucomicrobiaceae bacterium]